MIETELFRERKSCGMRRTVPYEGREAEETDVRQSVGKSRTIKKYDESVSSERNCREIRAPMKEDKLQEKGAGRPKRKRKQGGYESRGLSGQSFCSRAPFHRYGRRERENYRTIKKISSVSKALK
jgi:hypothetical protein